MAQLGEATTLTSAPPSVRAASCTAAEGDEATGQQSVGVPAGALAIFHLEPSGVKFARPLELTFSPISSIGGVPFAFLVSNTGPELAEVRTDLGDRGTGAAITVLVPHFSDLVIGKDTAGSIPGDDEKPAMTLELSAPSSALVGVPFVATATMTFVPNGPLYFNGFASGPTVETVSNESLRGNFTAAGLSPKDVKDAPGDTAVGTTSFTATSRFACTSAGFASLQYTAGLHLAWEAHSGGSPSSPETSTNSGSGTLAVSSRVTIQCTSTPTPTPPPPTRTPSIAETSAKPPVVTRIEASLAVPTTTYTVIAQDPDDPKAALRYHWSMIGETCGTPLVPWQQDGGNSITWSHSSDPPMNCSHNSPDHAVILYVTITTAKHVAIMCSIQGSETQKIDNPACQPPP